MAIRTEQPVGRKPELEQLGALLDGLPQGTAQWLAIEGEPGIGKTRLLSELRRQAEARGYLALSGSGSEFERDLPFGVWVDALDAYVASQELDDDALADLAGVLPSLRERPSAPAERHQVHRAVRSLLELLAAERPAVVVLDDLQWSDDASIEVLAAMLRRGIGAPMLLALGYRSGGVPSKLAAALAAPDVTILELGPLSEADCSTLAGEHLDAPQRAAVYAQSGGNPFYTLQLAQAAGLPSRSASGDRLARDAGVPRTVAAALVEELATLGAPARLLLESASIAGDPFAPELAFAIAELALEPGVAALDELLDARLLHPTDVPRRFAFRHPLVRRAVYETSKAGWRLTAHARAARALAAQGASAATRAHHVEQSGVQGEAAAIALLCEAGDVDAHRAPASAARWYAAALRLMPEASRPERLNALIRLARVQQSTGDLERCIATLLEALELVPADEIGTRVRLTSACAACEHYLGRHQPAERRLLAAFAALPDQGSAEAVAVLLDLATGAFFTAESARMCDVAEQALTCARALARPGLLATAAAVAAHSCAVAGTIARARTHADEAGALLDGRGDDDLAHLLDAVNRLAWAEHLLERFDDSIRHAARGVAVARATGQGQFIPVILGAQALSSATRGDLAVATALQEEALESAQLAANDYVTSSVLTATAHIAMARGDLEQAREAAEQSVACVDGIGAGHLAAMAHARLAVTLRALGDAPGRSEQLVAAAGGWDLPLLPPTWGVAYMEALTRIELDAGRLDQAKTFADAAVATAAALGLSLTDAIAQRAHASVLLADGDAETAGGVALASAAAADDAGAPVEASRARVLAGKALATAGERKRAIELLRRAEHDLDARGALRDRADARRQLRQLGARTEPRGPAATATSGLDSLSQREREIAILVTDRKTNKEIAAELFLSGKTVESHLRNIFAKLGASSRVDVARAVERQAAANGER